MDLPGQEVDGIMMQEKFLQIKILYFQFPWVQQLRKQAIGDFWTVFTDMYYSYLYESIFCLRLEGRYDNSSAERAQLTKIRLKRPAQHSGTSRFHIDSFPQKQSFFVLLIQKIHFRRILVTKLGCLSSSNSLALLARSAYFWCTVETTIL